MKILNHPACTHQLGAPSDMQDGSCDALPVMYQTTEHGTFAVSFWQPDADDLAELLAGGGINLWVRAPGRQHPVVALGTFAAPPTEEGHVLFVSNAQLLGKEWSVSAAIMVQVPKLRAENKALRDQVAALQQDVLGSFDDVLAAACIQAEVPDSVYESICIALIEILSKKDIKP